MYINQPALKDNHKKPKTTAKIINQYQFSSPQESPIKKKDPSSNYSSKSNSNSNTKKVVNRRQQQEVDVGAVLDIVGVERKSVEIGEYKDEKQFEAHLVTDLDTLLQKWQTSLSTVHQSLSAFTSSNPHISQTESQIKAYQHCLALLQAEFNTSQVVHDESAKFIQKKILQIDDYRLRLVKEIQAAKEEIGELAKLREMWGEQDKQREKRRGNRRNIQEKIREERDKIQRLKKSIGQCKDKSYQQKNQFIQLQTQQFRLQKQLSTLQQQQQLYQQESLRSTKHQELISLKQKILTLIQNIEQQVRPHLDRKIEKMARLRSQIANIDEVLATCLQKIEDQGIIIDALKEKSYHEEVYYSEEPGNSLYEAYRRRYNDIYFGDGGSGEGQKDVWNDYNRYLKHLVSKNNSFNGKVYTQLPRHKKSMPGRDRVHTYTNGDGQADYQDVLDLRQQTGKRETQDKFYGNNNSTKISYNPQKYGSQRLPRKDATTTTKLPRLVKLQGKANQQKNIKNKVKQGLVKNTNKEEQFSLESVHSDDSKLSGEIIQVQFHKK